MKKKFLLVLVLTAFLTACASIDSMKQARGQGAKRIYPYALDKVYEATLDGARRQHLDVVSSDKSKGMVILAYGVTWLAWGGRIAVFLDSATPDATEVEIINKPVLLRIAYSPDWNRTLLDEIEFNLSMSRGK